MRPERRRSGGEKAGGAVKRALGVLVISAACVAAGVFVVAVMVGAWLAEAKS